MTNRGVYINLRCHEVSETWAMVLLHCSTDSLRKESQVMALPLCAADSDETYYRMGWTSPVFVPKTLFSNCKTRWIYVRRDMNKVLAMKAHFELHSVPFRDEVISMIEVYPPYTHISPLNRKDNSVQITLELTKRSNEFRTTDE